jgi:hypothetical protein
MDIDKIWVEENIDELMNVFVKMNPEFKSNENSSRACKSRHKKKMLQNMDTTMYRPIYHIARFTKIKEMKLRKIIREQNKEISELETYNEANAENLKIYKDKSCKLAEENMLLKKRIQELEKNIK